MIIEKNQTTVLISCLIYARLSFFALQNMFEPFSEESHILKQSYFLIWIGIMEYLIITFSNKKTRR